MNTPTQNNSGKKRTQNATPNATADVPANDNGTVTPPTLPTLTIEQKKALFSSYEHADEKVKAAQRSLDEAEGVRSDAVKAIRHAMGVGPFAWKGKELIPMARGESHFMRGSRKEVEKIG